MAHMEYKRLMMHAKNLLEFIDGLAEECENEWSVDIKDDPRYIIAKKEIERAETERSGCEAPRAGFINSRPCADPEMEKMRQEDIAFSDGIGWYKHTTVYEDE